MAARAPSSPSALTGAVLWAALAWLPCCSPGDDAGQPAQRGGDSPTLVLGPGDRLLDQLASLAVPTAARSNLAPPVRAAMERLLVHPRAAVPADAWIAGGRVPARTVAALGLPVDGELQRFRCRPALRPDLGLGRVWLRHDGRLLEPSPGEVGERRLWWLDMPGLLAFRWDDEQGALLAFGKGAPGELEIGFDIEAGAELLCWEGAPAGTQLTRWDLDQVDRPALAVTTPTVLEWPLRRLSAATLELAVAVPDLGLGLDDSGRLVRNPGRGDGVTFAVELFVDGQLTRLWERHVAPGSRWTEARLELPAVDSGPLRLRLVTEPGPAGAALHDHALWAGLRLRGAGSTPGLRPHLVVIDMDTLRADRLGCYGAQHDTSPRIDAWARASAVLFENATSVESWTLPSTVSLLTGLAVSQHGVSDHRRRLTAAMEPLAARLAAAGYETLARTDGGYLIPAMGFAEGFERFAHRPLGPDDDWGDVLAWLAQRQGPAPVFCFLQTYRPHEPYAPDRRFDDDERPYRGPLAGQPLTVSSFGGPARRAAATLDAADRRWVQGLYDAAVFATDRLVGDFLDGLEQVFDDEPYLVLLTSDHGQELFERGAFGHGLGLHAEQLRVPMILRRADGARVGRSAVPVSGLDLVPTLLDAAGLPLPAGLPGRSLLGDLPSRAPQIAWHRQRGLALQLDGHKLIVDGDRAQLYELDDDPGEWHDRAAQRPELVLRLRAALASWLVRWPALAVDDGAAPELDPQERAALQQLGYLR